MESLKAGIRSSCRLDQEAVLDGSSPRGEDAIIMPTMVPVAFTAEGWPVSCRNGGRLQIGMPAGLRSEYWPLWRRKPWPLSVGICMRHLMVQASQALGAADSRDPDTLSFLHTVRVVRRHLPLHAAFSPSATAADADDDPG
ncbi:hypothetical protein M5E06_33000 [Azospirillum sp. A1-3]|uniref:hypothetical protein n=1 Tax=Azospirillum sp. A1-3 TaxID=185874 RepID=UPI00207719ED|nr:hypothetical protein [Azospirillum sp. A1-3]MCM8738905.1 hypothetical protein [Azospirillum sp. A1-3]